MAVHFRSQDRKSDLIGRALYSDYVSLLHVSRKAVDQDHQRKPVRRVSRRIFRRKIKLFCQNLGKKKQEGEQTATETMDDVVNPMDDVVDPLAEDKQ